MRTDTLIATLFQEKQISTLENGFLRFLHLLSFTDFTKTPLVLGSRDEKVEKANFDFTLHRERFPSLTIFVVDLDLESNISKDFSIGGLRRLVNCARSTLHKLVKLAINFKLKNFLQGGSRIKTFRFIPISMLLF